MSLSSLFCWVPRGQGQGDPTRHMVAIYHGCLPVFSLGEAAEQDDALPFDEVLDWRRFSLRVPTGRLAELPATLWPVARDAARLRAMQLELACAWRALFWTSLVGSCFGEDVQGDAFSTLMSVLRHRKQPRRAAAAAAARRSPCSLAVLPSHLARQVKASSRSLAPGASAELLELGGSVSV